MQKLEITSMSVSDIEALLKSKEDYKIALRLLACNFFLHLYQVIDLLPESV
jgi:hypothetical protein